MSHAAPLPSEQHRYEGLPVLDEATLHRRREHFFLVLAGLFLGTLAMLNILGVTHFIDLSFTAFGVTVPMPLAVGVLPYPLTFLCTDLMSELYGRERASAVVWVGLLLNGWVAFILWLGGVLPSASESGLFFDVRRLAFAAIGASMIAYLAAQLVDVHLFHFWKRLTQGRHLWLRNNASTLVSQLVDTVAVILITHFLAGGLPIDADQPLWDQLLTFIAAGYVFKLVSALADTGPFYLGVRWANRYLRLAPGEGPPAETSVEA
ncbi:MAG: transporter [Sandaracinus sp.]|nr:transporter [Sandaracinus sp.]|tara:strand:+ start:184 stop:972 length:789 start_codon:yes stop_codon:yes gene_type:complete